jgi:hypothetical protein
VEGLGSEGGRFEREKVGGLNEKDREV